MDTFVGREEDIRNITGYLDFTSSDVQVVHIVGPPGFGKSTLAKQIGHILLRKGVKVHYADIRAITNLDTVAEKIMLSIVDSTKHKVTFDHLERWVHKQYSNNLLILDNCDEMIETHEDEFLGAIRTLALSSYTRSVRYILTSQKWEADVGNYYQLHAIYNLSCEAASQLLGKLAPSLTDVQKMQIAELTGNVPLALDVVGALFKFPNAPTVEEVIHGLRENPVTTLSSSKIHPKLDVSIGLAYSYLSPELKQLCLNLSQFPGTFSGESAFAIFDMNSELQTTSRYWSRLIQLHMLVQRSLLQYNNALKRFHFHQLIQKYFLHVSSQELESSISLKQHFKNKFQLHFALTLSNILDDHLAVTILDDEKHNFQYMFSLFNTAKHVNNTYFGVKVTLVAIQMNILRLRFNPTELRNISWSMLTALESYTDTERVSESFLETYVDVIIETAKLESLHRNADFALEVLSLRQRSIDDGYKMQLVTNNTYIMFYRVLAQYYQESGQKENATLCHTHILATIHNELDHCYPHCDYFNISIAYESIGDSVHAFQFRKLAYEHQWSSLHYIYQAKLSIDLYNDYSNVLLGNSLSEAEQFSSIITETIYEYLLLATGSEYIEDIYYDAVDFFRSKNMEEHVMQLQVKMSAIIQNRCDLRNSEGVMKCSNHFTSIMYRAWKRQCYHLIIESGTSLLNLYHQKRFSFTFMQISTFIGKSYYQIGNYSNAQFWLKQAVLSVNEGLKYEYSLKLKAERLSTCLYLIISGDLFNIFCYGYIIKDFVSQVSDAMIYILYEEYEHQQSQKQPVSETVILSTETGVTEEKYSFVWSQFNKFAHEFKRTLDKQISRAINVGQLTFYTCIGLLCALAICLCSVCAYYMHHFCMYLRNLHHRLMLVCFTKQQIKCCHFFFACILHFGVLTVIVFVLGLDWLW